MNEQLAEETSLLLLGINAALDRHLGKLQPQVPPDEFNALRLSFAHVMVGLLDIVNPLYKQHPSLKPSQMGGPYRVPQSNLGFPGHAREGA